MFHFIRELNMIYDKDDRKGARHIGKKLSLDNFEVQNCFSPTAKTQELKQVEPKQRRKSDSYNDWHKSLQERSRYATAYSKPTNIHEMPELVSFVVEPKHHLNKHDVNVVLSEVDECALEKYTFSSDSESTDSTQETLQRLCFITNDYKLDSDSESCDSTKETLERLTCIANELKFGFQNDDEEEDFDVSIQDRRSSNDENPVEKIIHTVHSTKKIREKELVASGENGAEQIQHNQGRWNSREASSGEEDNGENESTLRSVSEIQGNNIPNPRGSVPVAVQRKRHCSEGSIQSSASGGSFAFPLLDGELTETPQVMPTSVSPGERQIVAAQRKNIHWYPRWRVLSCCRAI